MTATQTAHHAAQTGPAPQDEYAGVDLSAPLEVGETFYIDTPLESYLADPKKMEEFRRQMEEGHIVIFRRFASREEITALKTYLHNIQRSTIPNFHLITQGAHNNYRLNFDDERAAIRAFFHVWSFFPWNQDLFSLYERYRPVYHLRNALVDLPPHTFTNRTAELGCTARLSVQFYPSGKGYFTQHTDPYNVHQMAVPIMPMSEYGKDFKEGGNFVVRRNGERVYTESLTEPGDILMFNARCTHGVGHIDPGASFDPMSPAGRWMMLFAVNKLAGNTAIPDAVDRTAQKK